MSREICERTISHANTVVVFIGRYFRVMSNWGQTLKATIDLLSILQKSGSSDIFIHFYHEIRLSGVRASIRIVHFRKFY